jgi:hypothetical protein
MALLSGGGMALTVSAWRTTSLVADRSVGDPWPLAYALYGTLALLGLVLVSLGWVIGKTSVSGKVGAAEFSLGGGEADASAGAQLATDAAQAVVEELKP